MIENSLINTETLEKNKAVLRQKMTAFAAIFDLVFDYHALPSTETGMSPFSSYFEDFIHFMTDIQQLIDATLADQSSRKIYPTYGARREYYADASYSPQVTAYNENQLLVEVTETRPKTQRLFAAAIVRFEQNNFIVSVPQITLFEPSEEPLEVKGNAEIRINTQDRTVAVTMNVHGNHLGSFQEPVQKIPDTEPTAGVVKQTASYVLLPQVRNLLLTIQY